MKRIFVDFNAGLNDDGLMRLNTRGSLRALESTGATVGERVLFTDDDVCVEGVLVDVDGRIFGQFNWDDISNEENKQ